MPQDEEEKIADEDAEEVEEVEGARVDEIADDDAEEVEDDPYTKSIELSPMFVATAAVSGIGILSTLLIASSLTSNGHIFIGEIIIFAILLVCAMSAVVSFVTYKKLDKMPSQQTIYLFILSTTITGMVIFGVGSIVMLWISMSILYNKHLIDQLPTFKVM